MLTAIDGKPHVGEAGTDESGVGHIVVDGGTDLLLSFRGVDSLGSTLGDVAGTVELAALAAVPEGIDARTIICLQFLGDDGITTTDTREASCLREAAELDGTLHGSLNLVDGMRKGIVLDKGLVGGIIEDDSSLAEGIVDPG